MIGSVEDDGGIIPACAGSTQEPYPTAYASEDHPRMRGEHFLSGGKPEQSIGSSPHARGALK